MHLKEKLLASFSSAENQDNLSDYLSDVRSNALEVFKKKGFPTKKDEAWKYTSLNKFLNKDFFLSHKPSDVQNRNHLESYFIDKESNHIVFVDGLYASDLSKKVDTNLYTNVLSEALKEAKHKTIIEQYYDKATNEDGLSSLNTALSSSCIYIYISENQVIDHPIQITHFSTGNDTDVLLQPRHLIVAGSNAQVKIIETHHNVTPNTCLTNSVTEVFVDANAIVDYYKVQNDSKTSSIIDNTYIKQKEKSTVSVHTFSFGGQVTRNNLNFYQEGERINSILKGTTIISGKQHVDHNTLVHHINPNCESHQNYKGVFGEQSTGVFNGQIVVEKEAQNTNAFQANNNILTSDKASINTKPQLEIFADDVRCSHGCTIGQLDEDALFYIRSRGVSEKDAKKLLMYAFTDEVLNSVAIPKLKDYISSMISHTLDTNS